MRHSYRLYALATLLFVAPSAPGYLGAQTVPSPYSFIDTNQELGVFIGHLDSNQGRFSIGPAAGAVYGARYAIKLGDTPLAFEAVTFMGSLPREIIDPSRPEGERVVDEVSSLVAGADARLRLSLTGPRTWRGLNPYVALGLGAASDLSHTGADDLPIGPEQEFRFGPAFMGVAAGGIRWFPVDPIGVRGETSLHLWRLGSPRGFSAHEEALGPVPEQEWVGSLMYSLALTYRF